MSVPSSFTMESYPVEEKKTSFPKHKIKVLLMESISQQAVDVFKNEGFTVESIHKLSEDELIEKIKDVRVIGVRSKTKLTKKVLEHATKLMAVGCFCIGTDQTNLKEAQLKGIPVFNAPFANTRSVAELVISEFIQLARQAGDRNRECHDGVWNKRSKGCFEIRGKTLGIVGYGHVGSQVSILAEAMGMKVIFYDILKKLPLGTAQSVNSLEDLLKRADFLSLHVPKTPETINLIGSKELALLKPNSYVINAARGNVVDIDALAEALKSGHVAGAAVDVYPKEPASKDEEFKCPLRGIPNVILTPHIGGSTEEAQINIGVEVANKILDYINTGSTMDSVNFPTVSLPQNSKPTHRVINVHRNVPGVLRDINNILSQFNVTSQVLSTLDEIGYLIVEVDQDVASDCKDQIKAHTQSIRTRVLY